MSGDVFNIGNLLLLVAREKKDAKKDSFGKSYMQVEGGGHREKSSSLVFCWHFYPLPSFLPILPYMRERETTYEMKRQIGKYRGWAISYCVTTYFLHPKHIVLQVRWAHCSSLSEHLFATWENENVRV